MPTRIFAPRCGTSKDDALRINAGGAGIGKAAYVLLVLLIGMVLLFSACGGKAKKPEDIFEGRSGNYSTAARISYKGLNAQAAISQETPASCAVAFTAPASLKDMAFVFRQDSVDLSYKGLRFRFEQASVPLAAVARLAVSTINYAMRGDGVEAARVGDAVEITGIQENGSFLLRVDAETGRPIKLLIPAEELEIEFDNFTFLD